MKLKIKVTKEVLKATKYCGWSPNQSQDITANCAITYACRKLFPNCKTSSSYIWENKIGANSKIIAPLPREAREFIKNSMTFLQNRELK